MEGDSGSACAAQHAIGKILRHGYDSFNPDEPMSGSNRGALEKELGDVRLAAALLCEAGDINDGMIGMAYRNKRERVRKWLHHQSEPNHE